MKEVRVYIVISLVLAMSFAESQTVQGPATKRCSSAFSTHDSPSELEPISSLQGDQKHGEDKKWLFQNPRAVFSENFRKGLIEGANSYFVVDQKTFNRRIPLGRIIKKTSETSAVVEVIDPSQGTLSEIDIQLMSSKSGDFYLSSRDHQLFKGMVKQGRSDLDLVFSSLRSEREELSNKDLNLDPQSGSVLRSQVLKAQGYSQAYIRHIDEVQLLQALKRKLTEGEVNPYRTHIEYLANSLFYYINYIRQGVRSLPVWEITEGLRVQNTELLVSHFKAKTMDRINELEQRVETAIKNKQLTYQQFLKFIAELSQVTTYNLTADRNKKFDPNLLETLLEYFPIMIAMPQREEVGVMALNELTPQGVYPLGLSYRLRKVDGREHYSPVDFIIHDIFHAIFSMHLRTTSLNSVHEQFHNRWLTLRESLPIEERKNVELAYYTLTHEIPIDPFVTYTPAHTQTILQHSLTDQINAGHNFKGLKDFSENKNKEEVLEISEDWFKMFKAVSQDLGFPDVKPEFLSPEDRPSRL